MRISKLSPLDVYMVLFRSSPAHTGTVLPLIPSFRVAYIVHAAALSDPPNPLSVLATEKKMVSAYEMLISQIYIHVNIN